MIPETNENRSQKITKYINKQYIHAFTLTKISIKILFYY